MYEDTPPAGPTRQPAAASPQTGPAVIGLDGLAALIAALRAQGFRLLGPTRRDDAIVYDDIESLDDLPAGWTDELVRIAVDLRFDTLLVGVPDERPLDFIRRLGEEIAPAVRAATS